MDNQQQQTPVHQPQPSQPTQKQPCFMCQQQLTGESSCMLQCAAGHIVCFKCINYWVTHAKRQCPLDKNPIERCIHKGAILRFAKTQEPAHKCYICNRSQNQPSIYAPSRTQRNIIDFCQFCGVNLYHRECYKHQSKFAQIRQFSGYSDERYSQFRSLNYCPQCREQPYLLPFYDHIYVIRLMGKLKEQDQELQEQKKRIEERLIAIQRRRERIEEMKEQYQRVRAQNLQNPYG